MDFTKVYELQFDKLTVLKQEGDYLAPLVTPWFVYSFYPPPFFDNPATSYACYH